MSRLRLIAGPNGSGKSSIFQLIRDFKEKQRVISTGPFINSDVIEKLLRESRELNLRDFGIDSPPSSLIEDYLRVSTFRNPYDPKVITGDLILESKSLKLKGTKASPLVGMIVSDLIREYLLAKCVSFTMETVFSHPDKLGLIRRAIANGYKVYLYFVSTEDPMINVKRVEGRVAAGGHDVPHDKIIERYSRTMNNLYDAVKLSYRAYIFDNSGKTTLKVAEKDKDGKLYLEESVPEWLLKYLRIS